MSPRLLAGGVTTQVYSCEDYETLADLKTSMNFSGWVLSDWTATHSTADSINAGYCTCVPWDDMCLNMCWRRLDMEMPAGTWYSEQAVSSALANGTVSMSSIDDSVLRILTAMYTIGKRRLSCSAWRIAP